MLEALTSGGGELIPDGPIGQASWIDAGTYQWTCPEDVTLVCCVVVAAGQMSTYPTSANLGKAGDGGGLRWKNNIPVVPGTVYEIVIGQNRRNSASVKRVRVGGRAGVRIIWGGRRSYPNNAADIV